MTASPTHLIAGSGHIIPGLSPLWSGIIRGPSSQELTGSVGVSCRISVIRVHSRLDRVNRPVWLCISLCIHGYCNNRVCCEREVAMVECERRVSNKWLCVLWRGESGRGRVAWHSNSGGDMGWGR